MHKLHKTIDIKAPVQSVYDFITQPNNLPGIWPNMLSVSNLVPRNDGTFDFDWVYKMAGVHVKGHTKVEQAQSGKLAYVRNEGGVPGTFRWTFEGLNGSGTRMTLDVEYSIPTPLIGKVIETLVAKSNERDVDTLLANLKDVMEHAAASLGVGAAAH